MSVTKVIYESGYALVLSTPENMKCITKKMLIGSTPKLSEILKQLVVNKNIVIFEYTHLAVIPVTELVQILQELLSEIHEQGGKLEIVVCCKPQYHVALQLHGIGAIASYDEIKASIEGEQIEVDELFAKCLGNFNTQQRMSRDSLKKELKKESSEQIFSGKKLRPYSKFTGDFDTKQRMSRDELKKELE